jgi:ATP-dependent exoDNAse (exonuclease V) beta subunit
VGAALPVQRTSQHVDWAAFGDTLHGFLTADRGGDESDDTDLDTDLNTDLNTDLRQKRAERLLDACASGATLPASSLMAMSDALCAFVHQRWPGAIWHRELPIRVCLGSAGNARQVRGEIDLLLETDAGYVVLDHKTYGNPDEAAVREHAEQYLPQLAAYGRALEGLGKPVIGYWLHFGVVGICLRCDKRE